MASLNRSTPLWLLWIHTIFVGVVLVMSDDNTNTQVLADINKYRLSAGLPTLTYNAGAACLANQVAQQYKGTPCTNVTEEHTSPGLEPDFPNYPDFLTACKLSLQNTTDGQVLADCIPPSDLSSAATTATQNFTMSQEYQKYINMSDYVSAGVGSTNVWFVLVLATNTSSGNFGQTSAAQTHHSLNYFLALMLAALTGILPFV